MLSAVYTPAKGQSEKDMRRLLALCGLRLDVMPPLTLLLYDEDIAVATGSLDGNVLKYIAVDPAYAGEGAAARVVSELCAAACARGITHLFLCTAPNKEHLFCSLGFYPLAHTQDALLLENSRNGLRDFIAALPKHAGRAGCIVANADPFTRGHLYLCEQAAARCDTLYLFILSEQAGMFSPADRYAMARAATAHLPNICVCMGGGYMVSRATFPAYFIKDALRAADASMDIDIALFGVIAREMEIKERFVGTEPFCPVTRAYNVRMQVLLPALGVRLTELPRLEDISAGAVRRFLREEEWEKARALLPETTYAYIRHNA